MSFSLLRMGSKESLNRHKQHNLQPSAHNTKVLTDSIDAKEARKKAMEIEKKVEEIYSIFNQREYRNRSPHNSETVKKNIRKALQEKRDLDLIVIWGGQKTTEAGVADKEDEIAMDRLCSLRDQATAALDVGMKVNLTILFCGDIHQLFASGVELSVSDKYADSLEKMADARGIGVARLKKYYDKWYRDICTSYGSERPKILRYIDYLLGDSPTVADVLMEVHRRELMSSCKEEIADILVRYNPEAVKKVFAATLKHSKLVDRGVNPLVTTAIYMEVEREFMSRIWREHVDAIFVSFSNPSVQRPLLGDAPTLFLYATAHGDGHCPWYPKTSGTQETQYSKNADIAGVGGMDALMQACYNNFDRSKSVYEIFEKGRTIKRITGVLKRVAFKLIVVPALVLSVLMPFRSEGQKEWVRKVSQYPNLAGYMTPIRHSYWQSPQSLREQCAYYLLQYGESFNKEQKEEVKSLFGIDEAEKGVANCLKYLEGLTPEERYRMSDRLRGTHSSPMGYALAEYERLHGKITMP
ncbi:MAG: hypothetical protein QW112_02385 [Candidatus Micrarchaeia archaeon]